MAFNGCSMGVQCFQSLAQGLSYRRRITAATCRPPGSALGYNGGYLDQTGYLLGLAGLAFLSLPYPPQLRIGVEGCSLPPSLPPSLPQSLPSIPLLTQGDKH